jgi:hypothetical protein
MSITLRGSDTAVHHARRGATMWGASAVEVVTVTESTTTTTTTTTTPSRRRSGWSCGPSLETGTVQMPGVNVRTSPGRAQRAVTLILSPTSATM